MKSRLVAVTERRRSWLLAGALAVCAALVVVRGPQLLDARLLGVADFVEYWSAGRLNLTGGNPYAPNQLLPLQQAAGWDEDRAIPMWNPFWTMTLVMPLSALPFGLARLVWLVVEVGIVVGCVDFLWRFYGGSPTYRWLAWVLALTFGPTVIVLRMGQLGPFQLLGLCLFLRWVPKPGGWLAGAALVLATVKPHLLLLFWIALGLWILARRRWHIAAGSVATLLLASAVALAVNPELLHQCRAAVAQRLASETLDYQAPTPGAFMRLMLGERCSWVQYVPTALGLGWVLLHWLRRRKTWDWAQELPLLLLVSYATALYGWLGDQVVLLIPLVRGAVWALERRDVRVVRLVLLGYGLLNGLVLAGKIAGLSEAGQFWVAPALWCGYLLLGRFGRKGVRPSEERGQTPFLPTVQHDTGPCACVGTECRHVWQTEGV